MYAPVSGSKFTTLAAGLNFGEHYSVRNIASRIQEEKINTGQATRFIVNLDRSKITLDEFRDQLSQYPLNELDEIIVVKNGSIMHLFPFDK